VFIERGAELAFPKSKCFEKFGLSMKRAKSGLFCNRNRVVFSLDAFFVGSVTGIGRPRRQPSWWPASPIGQFINNRMYRFSHCIEQFVRCATAFQ